MSPELKNFLKDLTPCTEAGRHFNITNDYVSLLCRRKKVHGVLLGRLWFVDENSLRTYLQAVQVQQQERYRALSCELRGGQQTI